LNSRQVVFAPERFTMLPENRLNPVFVHTRYPSRSSNGLLIVAGDFCKWV
jgi:hypothetical protein